MPEFSLRHEAARALLEAALDLSDDDRAALAAALGITLPPPPVPSAAEAVVNPDGSRPVFRIEQGSLVPGFGSGEFAQLMTQRTVDLITAGRSVGRIESDSKSPPFWGLDGQKWSAGSCVLVAPGVVLTCRHVLQEILLFPGEETESGHELDPAGFHVDFAGDIGADPNDRFPVTGVLFSEKKPIPAVDLERIDLALLSIGPAASGRPQPTALSLAAIGPAIGTPIAVIGYPNQPPFHFGSGVPAPGTELEAVVLKLFGAQLGFKRCAAGKTVQATIDTITAPAHLAFAHDASTLGGNSGSPVFSMNQPGQLRVSGIEFAGRNRRLNLAQLPASFRVALERQGAHFN